MSRRKGKHQQVKKANRRIWAAYLQGLVADGYLTREEVFVFEPFRVGHHNPAPAATTPNPLAWETPKELQRPSGEPCDKCKRCAYCGEHHDEGEKQKVAISTRLWAKINALMDRFDKHEWLGVLTANEHGVFVDMDVPKQEVTGSTVGKVVNHGVVPTGFKIDGVIHSHVSMGAFHSGVDDEHLITNYPVSIVVSKKDRMEFEAVRTVTQECGGVYRYKTGVIVELESQAAWLEGVVGRVEVATPFVREVTPSYTPTGTNEPWMHGKPYCPQASCYRERDHVGTCMSKDEMKNEWLRLHPTWTPQPRTILCQKTNWCLRDSGHAAACSEVREHELCRTSGYCVLKDKHTGHCSGIAFRAAAHGGGGAWWNQGTD